MKVRTVCKLRVDDLHSTEVRATTWAVLNGSDHEMAGMTEDANTSMGWYDGLDGDMSET